MLKKSALLLLVLSASSPAQELAIIPQQPAPGAIVQVVYTPDPGDSVTAVRGSMGGERLHFTRDDDGAWRSLGPVPVDASDSVQARVAVEVAGRIDSLRVAAQVPKVVVASSNLSVSQRFTRPMDAETAARVAREGALAREVGRASHETPRLWVQPFRRPRNTIITSPFGSGRVFNGELTSRHLGVDFRGSLGQEVRAANRGVVALVDTFFLAGRLVYIDHGVGVTTAYFHLNEILVAKGDTVVRGQLIGRVGGTGRVTAPHLHWAARYGSTSVNPLDLIERTSSRPAAASDSPERRR
jgi:murein DD-endopeptidase MepM/ murein hydrolase activator NlpD